ncbi:MAG: type II toxin-antitoxin system VapC family toxin [Pirellulales bacterium]|nr:type II toxin-antitoxin system VapC family toxin [Pirellulales bacterium]
MIILDTDHATVLRYPEHSQFAHLTAKMEYSVDQDFAFTAITIEEQMRGWLAAIRRARAVHNLILYYTRLIGLVRFLEKWKILPFHEPAADRFEALRKGRIRIGTQDLKIASIALDENVLLLSANLRDFQQAPGLQVENWLH